MQRTLLECLCDLIDGGEGRGMGVVYTYTIVLDFENAIFLKVSSKASFDMLMLTELDIARWWKVKH